MTLLRSALSPAKVSVNQFCLSVFSLGVGSKHSNHALLLIILRLICFLHLSESLIHNWQRKYVSFLSFEDLKFLFI